MSQSHLPTWTEDVSSTSSGVNITSESNYGRKQQHTERTKAAPLAPQMATSRAKPTVGQYINDQRTGNYDYQDHYTASEGKRGTFLERDSMFDEFKYRELCLNAASRAKMVTSYLTKIKDHILKEASLEWEVRRCYLPVDCRPPAHFQMVGRSPHRSVRCSTTMRTAQPGTEEPICRLHRCRRRPTYWRTVRRSFRTPQ